MGCLAFLVIYFIGERLRILKQARCVPLRICVTGTRGKSTVTRILASCLREAGLSVLARTTGSRPVIILPDNEEEEILRRGFPSILEGKRLLKLGAQLQVKALVVELMSIHPESVWAESAQIFNPHILVMTNVRLDHLAQMGSSKEDIARCFAASFPERGTVFILQEEFFPVFGETAEKKKSQLIRVKKDSLDGYFDAEEGSIPFEFEENTRLGLAVMEFLKIDKEAVLRGLKRVTPDLGSVKVWTTQLGSPSRRWHLVNLFAANDPGSAREALSRLAERGLFDGLEKIGLLNLRPDRGDRTLQWLEALKEGVFPEFQRIFIIGGHAAAFRRRGKLPAETELQILGSETPSRIMERITKTASRDAVLVGIGNMGGIGKEFVEYWENTGKSYDI